MSAADLTRFDELVSRYVDGALTDDGGAELVALLAEPPLAAHFLEMTRLNSEIAGLLAAPVPNAAMVELVRTDIERILVGEPAAGGVRLRVVEEVRSHASGPPNVSVPRQVPQRRKPVLWAWAAVFFVFAGLSAVFFFNRTRQAVVPVVAALQGEVRSLGPAGERALQLGQSWQRGETLKTIGLNSAATLTFRDGSRLDFGGNTVAVNESNKNSRRVQIEGGSTQAVLKKQPAGRPFVFVTPEAEAIVTGTALRLVSGGHHTRLEVTEGEVRFRRRHDGAEVAVKAGHYALVAPNVPLIAAPFHLDPHHQ